MIAQFNVKIDGVWYRAGEEIPEKEPEKVEEPAKVEEPEPEPAPAPEPEPEPAPETESEQKEAEEAPRKTSSRRKKISE